MIILLLHRFHSPALDHLRPYPATLTETRAVEGGAHKRVPLIKAPSNEQPKMAHPPPEPDPIGNALGAKIRGAPLVVAVQPRRPVQ